MRRAPAHGIKRGKVALGFVVLFLAIGVAGVLLAGGSPLLPAVEACCLIPAAVVVAIDPRPGRRERRGGAFSLKRRHAIRTLRRQLDELPETAHPFPGG